MKELNITDYYRSFSLGRRLFSLLILSSTLLTFISIPIMGQNDDNIIIRKGQGVKIKKRKKPAKADLGAPCPCLVEGFAIDPKELVNESSIRNWANHGVVEYQAVLGELLIVGKLATRDPQEAHYWLRCAAQSGHTMAMAQLAMLIYQGDGVPRDLTEVVKWATKAADAGQMHAQHLLGNLYAMGEGVPQNDEQTIKWYTLSAEQGNIELQAALGYRYLTGDGAKKNLDLAIHWLQLAADHGHEEAKKNLALALEHQR